MMYHDLPIQTGDFPVRYAEWPKGISSTLCAGSPKIGVPQIIQVTRPWLSIETNGGLGYRHFRWVYPDIMVLI